MGFPRVNRGVDRPGEDRACTGIGERAKTIRVHDLHYIVDEDDSLLIVDDAFDSDAAPETR